MTPEEINRKCAEWEGRSAKFMSVNGVTYDQRCEQFPKDYYRSNAAMDLLVMLVERGYKCRLLVSFRGVEAGITRLGSGWNHPAKAVGVSAPTIPAAICHSIIELIEREGK